MWPFIVQIADKSIELLYGLILENLWNIQDFILLSARLGGTYLFNPSTWKTELGELGILEQPGLQSEILILFCFDFVYLNF